MLTDAQVRAYRDRGYVTVPGFFAADEVRAVEDYLVRHADARWTDKKNDPLREAHYVDRPIYEVCVLPRLLDCVERIIGPDIVLLYTHIISKPPGGMRVGWHQDGPYWPRIEPKVAVTAWMALDDANAENGCMRVIPGSHAGHVDFGQQPSGRPDLLLPDAIELPDDVADRLLAATPAEDIALRRGDVSFHDSYLVHGSERNRSTGRRAALTIRYVPATTRIQPREDRKQYLVRGCAADNGNVYFTFGN